MNWLHEQKAKNNVTGFFILITKASRCYTSVNLEAFWRITMIKVLYVYQEDGIFCWICDNFGTV